ncbi:hypothetical protein G5B37_01040 [Rasiella rasia]|uniref:DUF5683 domain-containing protein n=1 Tax=Rasiella rasia TaxID=2744027 RepID=A0A6G6GI25_9FLAO|nr:DUF5683 domain-containing protein [Rasiella rasia]QIE58198.1 hypothetical protein G5B37_01040 [Rasiella rasia]
MRNKLLHILFVLFALPLLAQTSDSLQVKEDTQLVVKDTLIQKELYNPLAPSKAAFYSAVLPGLGQAYNKKYWKIPIIYAGIGTGIYFHIKNDQDYDRFRNAYKRRLAGFTDDEFFGDGATAAISDDRLIDAQRSAQRNKDVSLIVAIAFYLVNVIDANVDAHLRQFNVSDDLSLTPNFEVNPIDTQPNYGLALKLKLQ